MSSKMYNKVMDTDKNTEEETIMKRRKKTNIEENESPKQILLPQKKRVLPNTDNSPAKKTIKSSQQEETVDDETLIRETEAALKSLSGSWPGPRGSSYSRASEQDESPTFENLFEEKKSNPKLSPSSASSSSGENSSCSLKDVITLRDQHAEEKCSKPESRTTKTKTKEKSGSNSQKEVSELENLLKIENECATIQYHDTKKPKDKKIEGSQYEPPDFNELVDDSSNELEIDMSESGDKEDENEDKKEKNKEDDIKRERFERNSQTPYAPYTQNPTTNTPTFSATSAFKPPTEKRNINLPGTSIPPLGPFPAEATFVGYPTTLPQEPPPEEDKRVSTNLLLKKDTSERNNGVPVKPSPVSIGSPETASSKQYTILQPAPAGSRAASAIQDIAREGVQVVSAVNSSASTSSGTGSVSDSPAKMLTAGSSFERPTGTLSPTSMSRGECENIIFAWCML